MQEKREEMSNQKFVTENHLRQSKHKMTGIAVCLDGYVLKPVVVFHPRKTCLLTNFHHFFNESLFQILILILIVRFILRQ